MIEDILFVIMHGISCEQRYNNVVHTWAKDLNFVFFSDYENHEKKIIKTTNDISYNGLEENAVKLVFEKYKKYKWFLFCDDDTYINVEKLMSEIENFDENKVHGQILIHGYHAKPELIFCSGGAGTLISNKILEKLSTNPIIFGHGIADVGICMNMEINNIEIQHSDLFYCNTPESLGIEISKYKDYISFHNIKTYEQMCEIHNIIKN